MLKIAYGKLGRSIPLTMENASSVGGDIEVIRLLDILRKDHEVHLIGRNRADAKLDNVVNYWEEGGLFYDCPAAARERDDPEYQQFIKFLSDKTPQLPQFDAWVIWLGQHGSSLHCVPAVQEGKIGDYTSPLISLINYGYPLVHMINYFDVAPIWLCPDPRNMIKMRDLWNPRQRPILAQYKTRKNNTFYDERDGILRSGETNYIYSGIEMLAVPESDRMITAGEIPFGALINEGPTNGKSPRRDLVKRWLSPLTDWELFGHWTDASQQAIGRSVSPVHVTEVRNTLKRWRSTITFPASSTGWATSKPWECFSAGTICFKAPGYDDQGHIYGKFMDEKLLNFLRVHSPSDLQDKINALKDDGVWREYAVMQLDYLEQSRERLDHGAAHIKWAIRGDV